MKNLIQVSKTPFTVWFTAVGLCLALLLVGSCKQDDPPDPEVPDPDAIDYSAIRNFVSQATPPRDTLTLPGMTIRYIGQGNTTTERVVEPDPDPLQVLNIEETQNPVEPGPNEGAPSSQKWILFNAENQQEFEVDFSGDLLKVIRERGTGGNTGNGFRGKELEEIFKDSTDRNGLGSIHSPRQYTNPQHNQPRAILTGWSRGQDSRRDFSSFRTRYPWRTISHFSNGCSGAFIGPQHVLTAAHCVYNRNTASWRTFEVIPGRGGASRPFGETDMDADTNPPGTWVWYFTPVGFRNNLNDSDGDGSFNDEYSPDDIAILITPDRLGETIGWMGRNALSSGALENRVLYNLGYPGCGATEAPAGCDPQTLYGDINDCDLNNYSSPNGIGWNRVIRASCDIGRGHSGSPLFYLFESPTDGTLAVATAVFFWQNCTTCSDDQVFVNRVRRITPIERDVIDLFRSWTGD